ncbi:MAG: hypothetical protein AAFR27_03755 [Pseudomonadota bacterium]
MPALNNQMTGGPVLSDEYVEEDFEQMHLAAPQYKDWCDLITEPMEENGLAPSDEAIGLSFDIYCEELDAPFCESEAQMADAYARVMGGIADLQTIAPDLLADILSPEEGETA